jgi:hypothetical protein
MHAAPSRRVAIWVGSFVAMLTLAACHGGGSTGASATGDPVDVKSACAALVSLRHSSDVLDGIDVADPAASLAALARAVAAYSASLAAFERVAPLSLRARAEAVRTAVIAHHFADAAAKRAAIDAWATRHCKG